MMRRANAAPEEQGLQAVLDDYEEMRGRALTHSIPPITLRNPERVAPSTAVGVPDPSDPDGVRFKDRQGEIFFYMHQQMPLAGAAVWSAWPRRERSLSRI